MLREILCLGFLIVISGTDNSDFFSALSDLEKLLHTEDVVLSRLETYIRKQDERLKELRWRTTRLFREHSKATRNITDYLSNPVNAYLLIKRLTMEWYEFEGISNDIASQKLTNKDVSKDTSPLFPTVDDLIGAVDALLRLQDVYKLDTAVIADGLHTGSKMSADDCFVVGQQLHDNGDTHLAADWLREAYSRFDQGKMSVDKKVEILEYLAFYTYLKGSIVDALNYINELLQLDPEHGNARRHKEFYEEIIWNGQDQYFKSDRIPSSKASNEILPKYKQLCRGEMQRTASEISKLRCRYVSNGLAFLKIAPFKLEEVNLDPYIVLFHDVLSDGEIEKLKDLAKPRLARATIANHDTGKSESSNLRISKSAWLEERKYPLVDLVSKRVEDMTGLTMETAEQLQVANYGMAGQYDPHFDFFHWGNEAGNNRIATVLFYMSDVSLGGATVFPKLGVSLKAKKGSAAFWYNLHSSGDLDFSTLHAACPVLIGEKWIANLWIRERGQEFRRKCNPVDFERNALPELRQNI
ncbi:prolyl 4-hydroxylase subunit alpha-1-like [Armigeres subalbatus]|uniref:prolyl 4-hydroxylase subunit alpha-1-like n=1 Tax=Armigeres subalbatus TaxID=124917 RepID=UPI002ED39235